MKNLIHSLATDQKNGMIWLPVKGILFLLSVIYLFFVNIIFLCYKNGLLKVYRLNKPVISIGNITWGGVGKTPLVEEVVRILKERGKNVVILTRGYMGSLTGHDPNQSDEVKMLQKALPGVLILAGANRVKNAQQLAADFPVDVFILDDGFQYWRLARDLDIVAIDATNPFGNGCLIPRGILRESISSIQRAGMIVLTKTNLPKSKTGKVKNDLRTIASSIPIIETIHAPRALIDLSNLESVSWDVLKGTDVCSFCSIANPSAFEATVEKLGARIAKTFRFVDHYIYQSEDIETISRFCFNEKIQILIATTKDQVKLELLKKYFHKDFRVYILDIRVSIVEGKEQFVERINSIL